MNSLWPQCSFKKKKKKLNNINFKHLIGYIKLNSRQNIPKDAQKVKNTSR